MRDPQQHLVQARQRGLALFRGAGEGPTQVAESASKPAGGVIPSTAGSPGIMTSILRTRVTVSRAAGLDVIGKTRAAGAANRT